MFASLAGISAPELILIFGIVLVLFGGKRLPEIARSLGKGIKDFKDAVKDDPTQPKPPAPPTTPAAKE